MERSCIPVLSAETRSIFWISLLWVFPCCQWAWSKFNNIWCCFSFSIHYPSFYCFDKDIFVLNNEYSNSNINYKDNPINKIISVNCSHTCIILLMNTTAFLHIFQYGRTACEHVNRINKLANKWLLRASSFSELKTQHNQYSLNNSQINDSLEPVLYSESKRLALLM